MISNAANFSYKTLKWQICKCELGCFSLGQSQLFLTGRFILAVVVYFVAGMIIMRVKYNKTGCDVIPNKDFWFTLPYQVKVQHISCFMFYSYLQKDGVFSPCINFYQNRRSGYASMK